MSFFRARQSRMARALRRPGTGNQAVSKLPQPPGGLFGGGGQLGVHRGLLSKHAQHAI